MSPSSFGFDRIVPNLGNNPFGAPKQDSSPGGPNVPAERAVVDCAVYVDGARVPGQRNHRTALDYVRERGEGFVWIGLFEPDERQMAGIADIFGLHELVTEDATAGGQRPKLERYDDTLVLNLRTVDYREHDSVKSAKEIVATGDILIVASREFVLTVRHGDFGGLANLRSHMEERPELLALGPSAVMHAVADHIVDAYIMVADAVEVDVEELESVVFSPNENLEIEHIYLLKREALELKHTITPLGTPLRRLTQDEFDIVSPEIRHYFRDVLDHHTLVAEDVTGYDERLTSLVNAAIARAGNKQNQDMRRISAWVAIAAVPTMIAGIYGMNFDNMPDLHFRYGYYAVLAFMVAICVFLYWLFRRNKWL